MTNNFESVSTGTMEIKSGESSMGDSLKKLLYVNDGTGLSKAAIENAEALAVSRPENAARFSRGSRLAPLITEFAKISQFLRHNVHATVSAIRDRNSVNVADAMATSIFGGEKNAEAESIVEEKDLQDAIRTANLGIIRSYETLVARSFVLQEEGDRIILDYMANSSLSFNNLINSFPSAYFSSTVDNIMPRLAISRPAFHAELEDHAKYTWDKLTQLFGQDIDGTGKFHTVNVPLDFDFDTLFKNPAKNGGKLNLLLSEIGSELFDAHRSAFSINIVMRSRAGSATSYVAKLSNLSFIAMPRVSIMEEAMRFFTQAKPEEALSPSTMYSWACTWASCWYDSGPHHIVISSITSNLEYSKKKEALGIRNDDTRADENGMFVDLGGNFTFMPPTSATGTKTAEAYVEIFDEIVAEMSALREPIIFGESDGVRHYANPNIVQLLAKVRTLENFSSYPLTINWDLNIAGSLNVTDPSQFKVARLDGGYKPNVVAVAELSDNTALSSFHFLSGANRNSTEPFDYNSSEFVSNNSSFKSLAHVYAYLRGYNKVRDIDEYLAEAAKEIHQGPVPASEFEYDLYRKYNGQIGQLISSDCTKLGSAAATSYNSDVIENAQLDTSNFGVSITRITQENLKFVREFNRAYALMQMYAIDMQAGSSGTLGNWERQRAQNNGTQEIDLQDSRYYFSLQDKGKTFQNLSNNYVVARAFAKLCSDVLDYGVSPSNILVEYDGACPRPIFDGLSFMPPFESMCAYVMPLAATIGKYFAKADEYEAKAKEEQKKFVLDETKQIAPIPGVKEGFAVFNHQKKALQLLANKPRVALLDIAPGGGKTTIGLIECAQLLDSKDIKLPLLVAPNNLVKNWINDLNSTVTDRKFNCVPITNRTLKTWGDKKLAEFIRNAPPNTIFHTDLDFIRNTYAKLQIFMMTTQLNVFANLEWLKQFDWDYILFDESHYLKGTKKAPKKNTYKTKRQKKKKGKGEVEVRTSALDSQPEGSLLNMLFAELTLRASVKYIRLASGTLIHKDLDDIIGQTRLFDPSIFRSHKEFLKKYQESSTEKGMVKDWVDGAATAVREHLNKYCAVSRAKRRDWAYALPEQVQKHPKEWLVHMDDEFRKVYEYIWSQTFASMGTDDELKNILSADEENVAELESLFEDGSDKNPAGIYISRLDRFLIAPELDPHNGYEGIDFAKLVSPKVKKLIDILDDHFIRERHGKVIVFVRHVECVSSIYKKLPPHYQKMAVTYHGGDKEGLVEFENNDGVQIIVGVEHSMNTGVNLQLADRVIRMEVPWAAGDVDQGIARVLRPDVKKKYNHPVIYDDWILVDNSMDIMKCARLIASTIRKTQFDEYGTGSRYENLPNLPAYTLVTGNFDIEESPRSYADFEEYFDTYNMLYKMQLDEYHEVRKEYVDPVTGALIKPIFQAVDGKAPIEGSFELSHVPLLEKQGYAPDVENDGLLPFAEWFNSNGRDWEILEKKQVLIYSEFGYGVGERFRLPKGLGEMRDDLSSIDKGLTPQTMSVLFSDGTRQQFATSQLYIATGVKENDPRLAKYIGANSSETDLPNNICTDPRDIDGVLVRHNEGFYILKDGKLEPHAVKTAPTVTVKTPAAPVAAPVKPVKPVKPVRSPVVVTSPTATPALPVKPVKPVSAAPTGANEEEERRQRAREAKERILAKRKAMQETPKAEETPAPTPAIGEGKGFIPPTTGTEEDDAIVMSVATVNDNVYLMANGNDPDAAALKSLEFKRLSPFMGIKVETIQEFDATIKLIEANYTIFGKERIEELRKRFSSKTKLFRGKLSTEDNLFISREHKMPKKETTIKLYHIVEGGELFLVFNIQTHPKIAIALNKKRPVGTKSQFTVYQKVVYRKFASITAAKLAVKRINKQVTVKNFSELNDYLDNIVV